MNYSMFDEIDYFTNLNSQLGTNNMTEQNNKSNNSGLQNLKLNSNLFAPYEGYVKGNLFKDLYDTYKNLKPREITIQNELDEMLLNIGQLAFARHELNLLLDNYPNNEEALNLFNRYQQMEEEQVKNYERRFGPLTISSRDMMRIPFAWEATVWPWEM